MHGSPPPLSMPRPEQWEEACRLNEAPLAAVWLERALEEDQVVVDLEACWLAVARHRAGAVARALAKLGMQCTPTPALATVCLGWWDEMAREKESPLCTPAEQCWNALSRTLTHLSDDQARVLALLGRRDDLNALLSSGAWTPTPETLFGVLAGMRGVWGSKFEDLLLTALDRFPGLPSAHPQGFTETLHRLLGAHARKWSQGNGETALLTDREKRLAAAYRAGAQAGVDVSHGDLLMQLARAGRLGLVHALGEAGCDLPESSRARDRFFKLVGLALKVPDGQADPRANAVPWRVWIHQAGLAEAPTAQAGAGVTRAWAAWYLENRLPPSPPSPRRARL